MGRAVAKAEEMVVLPEEVGPDRPTRIDWVVGFGMMSSYTLKRLCGRECRLEENRKSEGKHIRMIMVTMDLLHFRWNSTRIQKSDGLEPLNFSLLQDSPSIASSHHISLHTVTNKVGLPFFHLFLSRH